jgi:hypothetical protein
MISFIQFKISKTIKWTRKTANNRKTASNQSEKVHKEKAHKEKAHKEKVPKHHLGIKFKKDLLHLNLEEEFHPFLFRIMNLHLNLNFKKFMKKHYLYDCFKENTPIIFNFSIKNYTM